MTFLNALIARLAEGPFGRRDAEAVNAIIRQLQGEESSPYDRFFVRAWAFTICETSQPDFVIGPVDDPYVHRWWILGRDETKPNLYLHKFFRSDDDRALHDHPWPNASWLLDGSYDEVLFDGPTPSDDGHPQTLPPTKVVCRAAGDLVTRPNAAFAHRICLLSKAGGGELPAVTIFATGAKEREWGFHYPNGWRHWTEYVEEIEGGNKVGRGCD